MKILKTQRYKLELKYFLEFIAKDKISAMLEFRRKLNKNIALLKDFPYKYKKSNIFNEEQVRCMTFKGYSIIYEVFEEKIVVLSVYNQNLPLRDKNNNFVGNLDGK